MCALCTSCCPKASGYTGARPLTGDDWLAKVKTACKLCSGSFFRKKGNRATSGCHGAWGPEGLLLAMQTLSHQGGSVDCRGPRSSELSRESHSSWLQICPGFQTVGTERPGYKKGVEIHIFFLTPMRKHLDEVCKDMSATQGPCCMNSG